MLNAMTIPLPPASLTNFYMHCFLYLSMDYTDIQVFLSLF